MAGPLEEIDEVFTVGNPAKKGLQSWDSETVINASNARGYTKMDEDA